MSCTDMRLTWLRANRVCAGVVSGYRTVDALLQRMFEADLHPEDFAENDDPEAQNGSFANPTFSSA